MRKVVVKCRYVVTIPVEVEVEDNATEYAIADKAGEVVEDLLKDFELDFYDYEIEG